MKSKLSNAFLAILLFGCFVDFPTVQAQEAQVGKLTGRAEQGKPLYRRYCIGCHGPRGDGADQRAVGKEVSEYRVHEARRRRAPGRRREIIRSPRNERQPDRASRCAASSRASASRTRR